MAAQAPSRPPVPTYLGSTATSISLGFSPSSDDGGAIIETIILQVSPYTSASWVDVITYSDNMMSHTLTTTSDPIIAYQKYRFRLKSVNSYGSSDWSPEIALSVAPLPSAPPLALKNQQMSTTSSIMVIWTAPTGDTEVVTGYQL